MRKKETTALGGLLLALVAIGIAYGIFAATLPQQEEAFQQSINQTFHIGDTLSLNPQNDASDIFNGEEYSSGFGWKRGTLELTVEDARVGSLPPNKQFWQVGSQDPGASDSFLVCKVHIKNVDAIAIDGNDPKKKLFNITSIINCSLGNELAYYDGAPEDANDHDGYCFYLPQGSEATYTIAYPLDESSPATTQDVYLYAGMSNPEKYKIELGNLRE